MAVLLKNNVVFLHIPKTGGSWIIQTVKKLGFYSMSLGMEHSDHERIVNYSGHYLGAYLKQSMKSRRPLDSYLRSCQYFCFVREPVSLYESIWRFYIDSDWTQSRCGVTGMIVS